MLAGAFGRTAVVLLLLALAACGGIRGAPEPPIANFEAYLLGLQGSYTPDYVIRCLGTPLEAQTVNFTVGTVENSTGGQSPIPLIISHKECRDKIVQTLMVAIDLRYQQFELGFFDTNRQLDFGTTLAMIGLGTAGALVSGGTSQILSGTVAAVAGTREAFTKTVLAEQSSISLLTAMRAQRDKISLRIRVGLRENATQYPLGAALADVSAYYRAGTIVGALTGVTEAVGVERLEAREQLQRAISDPQFVLPPVRGSGVALPPQTQVGNRPGFSRSTVQDQPCPRPERRARIRACSIPELASRRERAAAEVRTLTNLEKLTALARALNVSTPIPEIPACINNDIRVHIATLCTDAQITVVERALARVR